jgi:diacylglycerol kinase family enzyme
VIAGLAGSEVPLGIIPLGTVNVLAREFGIPLNPTQALKVALEGSVRRIDLGMANGQPFALMAGLGFDAQVVSAVVPRLKELFGPVAYVTAGLRVLTRYKPSRFHFTADGMEFDLPAWLVVVGNASYYAYQLAIFNNGVSSGIDLVLNGHIHEFVGLARSKMGSINIEHVIIGEFQRDHRPLGVR